VFPFLAACRACTPPFPPRMHPLSGFAAHEKRINDASASPTARCDVPQAIALSLKHQVHRTNMHTEQLLALEGTNDLDDEHRKTTSRTGVLPKVTTSTLDARGVSQTFRQTTSWPLTHRPSSYVCSEKETLRTGVLRGD